MLRAKDEGDNREGQLRSWAFRLQRGWAEALERNIYARGVGDPSDGYKRVGLSDQTLYYTELNSA